MCKIGTHREVFGNPTVEATQVNVTSVGIPLFISGWKKVKISVADGHVYGCCWRECGLFEPSGKAVW